MGFEQTRIKPWCTKKKKGDIKLLVITVQQQIIISSDEDTWLFFARFSMLKWRVQFMYLGYQIQRTIWEKHILEANIC